MSLPNLAIGDDKLDGMSGMRDGLPHGTLDMLDLAMFSSHPSNLAPGLLTEDGFGGSDPSAMSGLQLSQDRCWLCQRPRSVENRSSSNDLGSDEEEESTSKAGLLQEFLPWLCRTCEKAMEEDERSTNIELLPPGFGAAVTDISGPFVIEGAEAVCNSDEPILCDCEYCSNMRLDEERLKLEAKELQQCWVEVNEAVANVYKQHRVNRTEAPPTNQSACSCASSGCACSSSSSCSCCSGSSCESSASSGIGSSCSCRCNTLAAANDADSTVVEEDSVCANGLPSILTIGSECSTKCSAVDGRLLNEERLSSHVTRLCVQDAHQLYLRLEAVVREVVIEVKVRLLTELTKLDGASSESSSERAARVLNVLLEEYGGVCNACQTLANILFSLVESHLRQFNVTWLLHNKHIFHNVIFTDPVVQNCVPKVIERVRHGLAHSPREHHGIYGKTLGDFALFQSEMLDVGSAWKDCQRRIDKFCEKQAAVKMKRRLQHEDLEFFKAQRRLLEQMVAQKSTSLDEDLFDLSSTVKPSPPPRASSCQMQFREMNRILERERGMMKNDDVGDDDDDETGGGGVEERVRRSEYICPTCKKVRCSYDEDSISHLITCGIISPEVTAEDNDYEDPLAEFSGVGGGGMWGERTYSYLRDIKPPSIPSSSNASSVGCMSSSSEDEGEGGGTVGGGVRGEAEGVASHERFLLPTLTADNDSADGSPFFNCADNPAPSPNDDEDDDDEIFLDAEPGHGFSSDEHRENPEQRELTGSAESPNNKLKSRADGAEGVGVVEAESSERGEELRETRSAESSLVARMTMTKIKLLDSELLSTSSYVDDSCQSSSCSSRHRPYSSPSSSNKNSAEPPYRNHLCPLADFDKYFSLAQKGELKSENLKEHRISTRLSLQRLIGEDIDGNASERTRKKVSSGRESGKRRGSMKSGKRKGEADGSGVTNGDSIKKLLCPQLEFDDIRFDVDEEEFKLIAETRITADLHKRRAASSLSSDDQDFCREQWHLETTTGQRTVIEIGSISAEDAAVFSSSVDGSSPNASVDQRNSRLRPRSPGPCLRLSEKMLGKLGAVSSSGEVKGREAAEGDDKQSVTSLISSYLLKVKETCKHDNKNKPEDLSKDSPSKNEECRDKITISHSDILRWKKNQEAKSCSLHHSCSANNKSCDSTVINHACCAAKDNRLNDCSAGNVSSDKAKQCKHDSSSSPAGKSSQVSHHSSNCSTKQKPAACEHKPCCSAEVSLSNAASSSPSKLKQREEAIATAAAAIAAGKIPSPYCQSPHHAELVAAAKAGRSTGTKATQVGGCSKQASGKPACHSHSNVQLIVEEEVTMGHVGDWKDSSSERSSATSTPSEGGAAHQRGASSKHCDCMHCEFFGHMPPPLPQNRNVAEVRERLRMRLKEKQKEAKKQQCTGGGDGLGGVKHPCHAHGPSPRTVSVHEGPESASARSVDELIRYINGEAARDCSNSNSPARSTATSKKNKHKKKQQTSVVSGVKNDDNTMTSHDKSSSDLKISVSSVKPKQVEKPSVDRPSSALVNHPAVPASSVRSERSGSVGCTESSNKLSKTPSPSDGKPSSKKPVVQSNDVSSTTSGQAEGVSIKSDGKKKLKAAEGIQQQEQLQHQLRINQIQEKLLLDQQELLLMQQEKLLREEQEMLRKDPQYMMRRCLQQQQQQQQRLNNAVQQEQMKQVKQQQTKKPQDLQNLTHQHLMKEKELMLQKQQLMKLTEKLQNNIKPSNVPKQLEPPRDQSISDQTGKQCLQNTKPTVKPKEPEQQPPVNRQSQDLREDRAANNVNKNKKHDSDNRSGKENSQQNTQKPAVVDCANAAAVTVDSSTASVRQSSDGAPAKSKRTKRNNKSKEDINVDEVFMPKDTSAMGGEDHDEFDREIEEFKRFCMNTPPPQKREKLKVHLNLKDIFSAPARKTK